VATFNRRELCRNPDMPMNRRQFMQRTALAGGAVAVTSAAAALLSTPGRAQTTYTGDGLAPGRPNADYQPVVVPNGVKLPWKVVDGVKVFHLVAEEVEHEFAPGLKGTGWGYNGMIHGPTIEAVEGDRVRFYVTNKLPEPTTVHWHGIRLPNGMDGVGGLTQHLIQPGDTFKYEFVLRQHGTYMYHPHHDEMTQLALGMMGLFVIHPRTKPSNPPDRDFAIMLSEWRIVPGTSRPDPMEMTDFNVLTMNAKAFPGTDPLVVKTGERVRIRLGNLGAMEHHPIHLHGYQFRQVETDGASVPEAAQQTLVTTLVSVGSTRGIEFIADAPGDWAFHCHMSHHVMNQMGHNALNLIGVDTDKVDEKVRKMLIPGFMQMGQDGMGSMADMSMNMPKNSIPMVGGQGQYDPITMGGMFTILKVRDDLKSYDDPGWYKHPAGTLASSASADELKRDGIEVQEKKAS
jgi:FtsP/CotA-like multicopper oxidase with cupredoxin domain